MQRNKRYSLPTVQALLSGWGWRMTRKRCHGELPHHNEIAPRLSAPKVAAQTVRAQRSAERKLANRYPMMIAEEAAANAAELLINLEPVGLVFTTPEEVSSWVYKTAYKLAPTLARSAISRRRREHAYQLAHQGGDPGSREDAAQDLIDLLCALRTWSPEDLVSLLRRSLNAESAANSPEGRKKLERLRAVLRRSITRD